MWTWITRIVSFLPGLGSLFSSSERAQEIQAEIKLEEAKAFSNGRVAPRYIRGYVACGVVLIFALLIAADAIWPDAVDLPGIETIAKSLKALFDATGGE